MEPSNNTETEEETIALKKKKQARRVSFADNEITSVHIFRRDDSSTTSSDAAPEPVLGFFRDLAGDSDDDDDHSQNLRDDDGSGGEAVEDSSTTTADDSDEDGFDGPVSASFIRPERLSDSGASDDVTMDSTAFSLHYRSLARSDSGDLKTPTRFGEMTSGRRSPSGSLMDLTDPEKKPVEVAVDVASGGRDSDDMCIVGEHQKSYDFGKLSPRLLAILAEGSKDLRSVSPSHSKAATDSPSTNDMSVPPNLEFSVTSPAHRVTHDNTVAAASASASKSSTKEIKEFVKNATVPACKQLDFAKANRGTPLKTNEGDQLNLSAEHEFGYCEGQVNESNPKDKGQVSDSNHKSDQVNGKPIHGFTPSSFSTRKHLFMGSPGSSRYSENVTPPLKQSGSFVPEVHVTHGATLSSIHKSISKLNTLETTPNTSTLKEGIDKLKRRLSKYSPGTSLFSQKDCEYKQVETLAAPLEKQPLSLTLENNMQQGLINMDDHGIDSFKNISELSQNEVTVATRKDKENYNLISADVSYNDVNPKPVEMTASSSQKTHLTRVLDFDLADSAVEKRKDEILIVMHDKPFYSPVKSFDQNLSPSIECQSNLHGELKQLEKQNESVNSGLGQAIEYSTQTVANKSELSGFGNSEQPTSPLEVAQVHQSAKSASKRKPAESPSNRVLVPSTPIQEATTLLPILQEPLNELLPSNIPDLSNKGNTDGHGLDHDNNYHPVLQVAQSPLSKSGIEVSSGKKRKGVELLSDGDKIDKMGKIDRSPEVHKSRNGEPQLVLEQTSYLRSEREKLGDQTWNDWDHILKEFSLSTEQLLSLSADKLNLRLIGKLEDILVHLQKVKKWDILCSEIHSQKLADPLRHKRVMETRMLLFNIVYEKAKLQLMHMKRERLLKKVQQLSSGLQETEMMKNSIPCSTKNGSIDIRADDSHIHGRLFNSQEKYQVSCKKVMEMRQELESLDWKANSLSEFLYSYCKIEGDQSYASTVKSVLDYLKKRMSYRFIFQDLKLWGIEDFERKDGHFRILLNYCGHIIQRFTVNAGQSSIIISNNLNDVNIGKTFPNMDVFSAFVFIINPYTTKKCTGRISMAQETQTTSLLLRNLLDVVEEVQLARIEIRNLVQAKFYSHSVHQLDLQLSFIDFCSGRKVQVTLDMTCLKCGAYPVEVLPSQIYDPAASGEQYMPLPSSLVDEMRRAAESVRVGYSRIIRLCRCFSQVIHARMQSR